MGNKLPTLRLLLAQEIAKQMAAELAGSMEQTVRLAYSSDLPNNKRRAILSAVQQKALDDIRKQVRLIEDKKIESNNTLTGIMNQINGRTRRNDNQLGV